MEQGKRDGQYEASAKILLVMIVAILAILFVAFLTGELKLL